MNDDLVTIIEKQFNFLKERYSFKLIRRNQEKWGCSAMCSNLTTAVKLEFENKEHYLFITLYKLEDGKFIDNPIIIRQDSILHGYGLDDILLLKNPSALMLPMYNYSKDSEYQDPDCGLHDYISDFAKNLNKYASDVLNGDFVIFIELDKIVRSRIKKN